MANLDAIYRVIHQPSGHVVDSYDSEASALACVERENDEYPDSHVVVKYVRATQAQQPAAAVPDGYALVPVEPTPSIALAISDKMLRGFGAYDAWRAGVAAALAERNKESNDG